MGVVLAAGSGKPVSVLFAGDFDPTGRAVPRSVVDPIARYSDGNGLDLDFQQIAVTAADVRSGQFTTRDVNIRDVNYKRYREEWLTRGPRPRMLRAGSMQLPLAHFGGGRGCGH
ncbi:hypothetical protein [Nonomuraea basaltis]|uniref:hypothetical protein n=1 Tax=Nonomuraea basaltis TaxID=2495887 RepID=UPI00110C47C1|nr:hypothetical protein [Nonomuraea basaltis]TMR93982.1 hypothetical protein EJK15_36375 [Nonomuraea basaltis]